MPKGIYERKKGAGHTAPVSHQQQGIGSVTEVAPNTATPKMVAMDLKRHYVPMGEFEVVGHTRPAKSVKDAAGKEIEVSPEKFMEGEMYPPVYGGVGFDRKVWAGTTIRVPEEEGKRMQKLGIAERGFHD